MKLSNSSTSRAAYQVQVSGLRILIPELFPKTPTPSINMPRMYVMQ